MAMPALNRFEFTVLKNKSSSDNAQVPAAATVTLYPPGVLCRQNFSFPGILDESVSIQVEFGGDVREGDHLAVFHNGALSTNHLIIDTVGDQLAPTSTLNVYNDGPIVGSSGDWLVIISRPLTCYPDPQAQESGSSSVASDAATGRASAYLRESRWDLLVAIPGLSPRLYPHSFRGRVESILNVRDWATVQAAIDACPAGGRVYLPAGTYSAPQGGLVISKSLELFGDGPWSTFIKPHSAAASNEPVIKLDATNASFGTVHLHDFQMQNDDNERPTTRRVGSHGLSCITPEGHTVSELRIERVMARNLGDDGIHLEGANGTTGAIVFVFATAAVAMCCLGSGFYVENATVVEMHNCYANANELFGAYCQGAQVAWYSCAFEDNCRWPSATLAKLSDQYSHYSEDWGSQLRLKLCVPARVESCDFEHFADPVLGGQSPVARLAKTAIIVEGCFGCLITNSTISNSSYLAESRGILVSDEAGNEGVTILPNQFSNVGEAVLVGRDAQFTSVFAQRVTGSDNNSIGVVKAAGLAIPALPSSSIQSPSGLRDVLGQVVYDLDGRTLKCWDSERSRWISLVATVYPNGLATMALAPAEYQQNLVQVVGQIVYDTENGVLKCWNGTQWKTLAWV